MTQKRMTPIERRQQIIEASVALAEQGDYRYITTRSISERLGVSRTLIIHYFDTMQGLRNAVMRYAVANERLLVIGQGLVANDPIADKASDAIRRKARKAWTTQVWNGN